MDIPDLFKILLKSGRDCVAFPLRKYWLDIQAYG